MMDRETHHLSVTLRLRFPILVIKYVIDKLRVAGVLINELRAQRVYQAYLTALLFRTKTLLPL